MINLNNIIFPDGVTYDIQYFNAPDFIQGKVSTCTNFYRNAINRVIRIDNLDTSNVTDMYGMFNNCDNLKSIDLSSLDTSNVTDMGYMFYDCNNLFDADFSRFNTSNVTNVSNMFPSTKFASLDLSSFDFGKVSSISLFLSYYSDNSYLTNLNFGKNLKINWTGTGSPRYLPNLTKESLLSIIDGLYDFVGNGESTTRSCQFGSTNLAKLTEDEIALATAKGWTLTT